MSNTNNSPKVQISYRATGFDAEFEVGWAHTDGHVLFRDGLISLLDSLHATWNKHERPADPAGGDG